MPEADETGTPPCDTIGVGARVLREGRVYSLALSPYQYIARSYTGVYKEQIAWVLVPVKGTPLITGPVLYVNNVGRIARGEGQTDATTNDLDFTGRYADGNS